MTLRLSPYPLTLFGGLVLVLLTHCSDRDALPSPRVVWATPTEVLGAQPDIVRPPWLVADGVMVIGRNLDMPPTRSFIKLDREDGSVLGLWNPPDAYSVGNGNKHVHGSVMAYNLDNRFIRIFDTERMEVAHDISLPSTATYISGLGSSVFTLQAVSYTESRVWQINLDTYDARPLFATADTDTSFFGFATLPVPYVNDQLDTCLLMLTRPSHRLSLNRFALINYPIARPEQADTIWLPRYFDTDNPPVFTVYHQGMVVCSDLENNQLVGIDINRKQIAWNRKTNTQSASDWPVAGNGRFYIAASSFLCLDITTGETVWENKEGTYGIQWGSNTDMAYSSPVVFLGNIALSASTGAPLWDALDEYDADKLPFWGKATVDAPNDRAYFTGKHGIYAILHPQ
ncbi:MAG: PQQ-binding-like beta-propeller repeat protein [Tunicatimonas sp.]